MLLNVKVFEVPLPKLLVVVSGVRLGRVLKRWCE
jgi:hypothetical protein